MPLPRYYCDYCDLSFHDTPGARRRHLATHAHQVQVRLHYQSYQHLSAPSTDDGPRVACSAFVRTGFCPFGTRCRFAHALAGGGARDLSALPAEQLPPSLRPPRAEDDYDLVAIAEWG